MRKLIFPLCLVLIVFLAVFFNHISAPIALTLGIAIGLSGLLKKKPIPYHSKAQSKLLKASVIGLGFGIDLQTAVKVGGDSFFISLSGIVLAFAFAFALRHLFKTEKIITFLVAAGTAICGGSAIAAVSPGVKATGQQTSIALAVVFVLNSVALFIFPPIGHFFELTQNQFGVWAAIAIHDTSSVVGASNTFGEEALLIATTTKLVRALWIVPLVLLVSLKSKEFNRKSFPWFIIAFITAICVNSFIPAFENIGPDVVWISKRILVFTLFLIGLNINMKQLKELGFKTFAVGFITWILLAVIAFFYVLNFLP